jgi:hypothetical protein
MVKRREPDMASEKPLAQKLQIKPDQRVRLINPPRGYATRLGALPAGAVLVRKAGASADVIQLFVDSRAELEANLAAAKAALASPKSSLWVTNYKGTSKVKTDIHRDSINAYAHTLGLEGVAMISIDDDWSALRLKLIG